MGSAGGGPLVLPLSNCALSIVLVEFDGDSDSRTGQGIRDNRVIVKLQF